MALRFAERLAYDPHQIDDEFFEQLRGHYSEPEILELGWAVGSFLFRGRLNVAFGLG